jgi:hypothetical protein
LTTTEGQSTYAAPSDIYAPLSVRNSTDGKRLQPLSIRNYDRILNTALRQAPTHYVWWRNELILYPVPDATQRIILMRYMKRLAALTTSTSLSALPREWDEVIVQGGFFRMLRWLDLKEEAQVEQQEYIALVQRRLDRISEGQFDRDDTAQPVLIERTAEIAGWSG